MEVAQGEKSPDRLIATVGFPLKEKPRTVCIKAYVDKVHGNDRSPGTYEYPVKTTARAIAICKELGKCALDAENGRIVFWEWKPNPPPQGRQVAI